MNQSEEERRASEEAFLKEIEALENVGEEKQGDPIAEQQRLAEAEEQRLANRREIHERGMKFKSLIRKQYPRCPENDIDEIVFLYLWSGKDVSVKEMVEKYILRVCVCDDRLNDGDESAYRHQVKDIADRWAGIGTIDFQKEGF